MTSKLNLPENLQGKKKRKNLIANMNKCKIKILLFSVNLELSQKSQPFASLQ